MGSLQTTSTHSHSARHQQNPRTKQHLLVCLISLSSFNPPAFHHCYPPLLHILSQECLSERALKCLVIKYNTSYNIAPLTFKVCGSRCGPLSAKPMARHIYPALGSEWKLESCQHGNADTTKTTYQGLLAPLLAFPENRLFPTHQDIILGNTACLLKASECATRPASKSWGWMVSAEKYALALYLPLFLINLHEFPW